MRRAVKALVRVLALACFTAVARAEETVKVEVRVTSVTSGSCYIDKGRAAGLQPGDRVTFFPSAGPGSEGTIRSVSKNSARAEFDTGAPPVQTGDRGEVQLPRSRTAPPPAKPATEPTDPAPKSEPTSEPPTTTDSVPTT